MGFISKQIVKVYKSTLFKRHDDNGSLFYFSIDDFQGLKREKYSFKTKKGHTLNGYFYFYGENNSKRLIVFDHGMGSGHRAYFKEIDALAREGYLVYAYDHTGCTESEGEHMMGLSGSLADLDSCIHAMISKGFETENISVVGHSWGAFSTLNILSFHPQIKNIVAISGFVSVKDMIDQLIPGFLLSCRSAVYKLEEQTNPEHFDRNAIQTLLNTTTPALIIHSTDDNMVLSKRHYEKMRKLLSNKENISFLTLSGKVHNPTYTSDAVTYKNKFFKDFTKRNKKQGIADIEAHKAYLSSYDWHRMTAQDEEVWKVIFEFLNK